MFGTRFSTHQLSTFVFESLLRTVDKAPRSKRNRYPAHLVTGVLGEEAAFFYLRRAGYLVVARGWRTARAPGDLDLIAWKNDTLCFIEVKTRSSREVATAEAAVDEHKRETLRRLARNYLRQMPEDTVTRFDVLSIYFRQEGATEFEFFPGAFDWF